MHSLLGIQGWQGGEKRYGSSVGGVCRTAACWRDGNITFTLNYTFCNCLSFLPFVGSRRMGHFLFFFSLPCVGRKCIWMKTVHSIQERESSCCARPSCRRPNRSFIEANNTNERRMSAVAMWNTKVWRIVVKAWEKLIECEHHNFPITHRSHG